MSRRTDVGDAPPPVEPRPEPSGAVSVELSAVIVAATPEQPRVLTVRGAGGLAALPSGPLASSHRTLEAGLRTWVAAQTGQSLGYVEQLYSFGDRNRAQMAEGAGRALSIGYLALAREVGPAGTIPAAWHGWYGHFPWEDRRDGRPPVHDAIAERLAAWAAAGVGAAERRQRTERIESAFGSDAMPWDEEPVLDRYQLMYEVGLVAEAHHDRSRVWLPPDAVVAPGATMAADHRRILATAMQRLRAKIKYRPLVFELMPPSFTFLQLQQTVEAIVGLRLHKPNFRRLVAQQGLIEATGAVAGSTGGRPAQLFRFRPEVLPSRPGGGLRLPRSRRPG